MGEQGQGITAVGRLLATFAQHLKAQSIKSENVRLPSPYCLLPTPWPQCVGPIRWIFELARRRKIRIHTEQQAIERKQDAGFVRPSYLICSRFSSLGFDSYFDRRPSVSLLF